MGPSAHFRLAENAVAAGYKLFFYEETTSTNDEALRIARAGDPGRSWFVAGTQTKGRGRRGRQWLSPPGNLHATLLLIDEVGLPHAPKLGFVAGVALARALRECMGNDVRLRLKWPNDVLFDGAKLAGILLEGVSLPDGRLATIVGIGVNCATSPRDLPYRAIALADIGVSDAAAERVFLYLSQELVQGLETFAGGEGFACIREEWLSLAAGLGAPLRVDISSGSITGIFRTIDDLGRLIVEQDGATKIIEAGDVWLAGTHENVLHESGSWRPQGQY